MLEDNRYNEGGHYGEDTDYAYDYNQQPQQNRSIKGLKVMIIILAVILAALSFLYYSQVRDMKRDFAEERDTLTNRLSALRLDYDNIHTENDTINAHLSIERGKVDSLIQTIQKERNLNRSKIREYEKQLTLMRSVMEQSYQTIDSLDRLNKRLTDENVGYRRQVQASALRAEKAEERAKEAEVKVTKGSVIQIRNINLVPLSDKDKEVPRARRAAKLRADAVLIKNELANPGRRNVYLRIIGPDGFVKSRNANATFNFEGDMITYSAVREVDYNSETDLPVSLYYEGSDISEGKYSVMFYVDSQMVGSTEIILQ